MARTQSTSTLDDPTSAVGTTASEEPNALGEAAQQTGETATHLAQRATELGMEQADRGKDQAAEGIEQVAGSIRRVATDMQGEQPAIANAANTAAEQAERLASYLQQTDAREMLRTVEDVARRQPLLFLGGAFALGVVASRFIKAAGGGSGGTAASRRGHGSEYRTGSYTGMTDAYRPTGPGASDGRGETSRGY